MQAHSSQESQGNTATEQRRLLARIDRISDEYEMGGITRDQYSGKIRQLKAQLLALELPEDRTNQVRRLDKYLRDLPQAWTNATQAQRNKLLRTVFDGIKADGPRLVACKPRTDRHCF